MIITVTLNPSIDYIVHLDNLKIGEVNRMKNDFKFPGGKGINVSRILNELEIPSVATGFLGGFTGQFVSDKLNDEKIKNNFVKISDDTRINIKLKSNEETEINGAGPQISDEEIAHFKKQLEDTTNEGDVVVLSGSIPASLNADFYDDLIAIVQKKNAEFVIDTTGDALLEAAAKKPLLVKPNNFELGELFNVEFKSKEEIVPYGKKLLDAGAKHVLVSMAGDGALLITNDRNYFAAPIKGTVKNSVGAGDSMIAGFTGTFHKTHDVMESFKYGVACGTATAFSDDLATKEKINEILQQVEITEI